MLKFTAEVFYREFSSIGGGIDEYYKEVDVMTISLNGGEIDYIVDYEGNEYSRSDNSLVVLNQIINDVKVLIVDYNEVELDESNTYVEVDFT